MRSFQAFVFDAYGTLFDVYSVTALCESVFPEHGHALAQRWREKQLQYSLLRSMMQQYSDFWQVTRDGLSYAARTLRLDLSDERRERLMDAYLTLAPFPDVKPGLEALQRSGMRLAILSNGEPRMLAAAARSAGLADFLETIISVDEAKVFKPSPKVYALAGQALQLPAGDIGFVSANSWDIAGAGAAGLKTFWLQRTPGEPEEVLGFRANRVIQRLTDLP